MSTENNLDETKVSEKNTETPEKPKKKGGLIAILIAAIILIIAGIVCILFFCTTIFLSPKQKVMLSLSKAFGSDSIVSIVTGNKKVKSSGNFAPYTGLSVKQLADIRAAIDESGYQTSFEAKLTKLKSDNLPNANIAKGAAIGFDSILNKKDRTAYANVYAKYLSLTLLDAEILVEDSDVSLALGDYLDGYFTLNTENFGKDYKKSFFYDEMDDETNEILKDLSFNIFDLMEKRTDLQIDLSQLFDESGDAIKITKKFYDSIEVEETGAKESFEVGGKDLQCKEYKISIDEKDLAKYLDSYEEFLLEATKEYYSQYFDYLEESELMDDDMLDEMREEIEYELEEDFPDMFEEFKDIFVKDYEFYVYLDNKCRLIDFFYEDSFTNDYDEDLNVALDLTWHGKEYLFDDFDGSFIVTIDDDEENAIYFANEGKTEDGNRNDEFTVLFENSEDDENNMEFVINSSKQKTGEFDYNLKITHLSDKEYISFAATGKETVGKDFYELNVDDFIFDSLLDGDKTNVSFSFFYSIGTPYDEIPSFKGTEYQILKMDEDDLEEVFEEIYDNVEDTFSGAFDF